MNKAMIFNTISVLLLPFFILSCALSGEHLLQSSDTPYILHLNDMYEISLNNLYTAELGAPPPKNPEIKGGATAVFEGNGDTVCIILDPEGNFKDDNPYDDGDLDLYTGLSSDYTGIYGEEIGDFNAKWVDELGVSHEIDLNICFQYDRYGVAGAHAGRGTPEYCEFDTEDGVSYTILIQTFSAPIDDNSTFFGLKLIGGSCPSVDENTIDEDW